MTVIIFTTANPFVDANCDALNFGLYPNTSIVALNARSVNRKGDSTPTRSCPRS